MSFGESLLAIIPQNPFAAAAQGELLPLIVAVCIFAAAATTLPEEKRRPVVVLFERMNDLSMIVIKRMNAVPIGSSARRTSRSGGASFERAPIARPATRPTKIFV
jgi:Na+/H+-dicarboxylate symporter